MKPNHWIGVAVAEHIHAAVAGGFIQLGHGKQAPLKRLSPGDQIVLYATKQSLDDGTAVNSFVAVGEIDDEEIRQVSQTDCFHPFRRGVTYDVSVNPVSIRPMLSELDLTKERGRHWGMALRQSLVKISENDFRTIIDRMKARTN